MLPVEENSGNQSIGHNSLDVDKLVYDNRERLKELSAINQTTAILRTGKPIEEAIHQITLILPKAWQYPEFTVARIRFGGFEVTSPGFRETEWLQKQSFETIDNQDGSIEIYYLKAFPPSYEGPFLQEERHLIINLANIIAGYINSVKGKAILKRSIETESPSSKKATSEPSKYSRQLLQTFLNRNNFNRDIYHDLKSKKYFWLRTFMMLTVLKKKAVFQNMFSANFTS
jgi:hypothetical protein